MLSISFVLIIFFVNSVFSIEHPNRERVASLIVLPPIVIGYDELYDDVTTKKPPPPAERRFPKQLAFPKTNNTIAPKSQSYQTTTKQQSTSNPAVYNLLNNLKLQDVPKDLLLKTLLRLKNELAKTTRSSKVSKRSAPKSLRGGAKEVTNTTVGDANSLNAKDTQVTQNVTFQSPEKESLNTQKLTEKGLGLGNMQDVSKDADDSRGIPFDGKSHLSFNGDGSITDPKLGDTLNFKGKFKLPNALFDCPCRKEKNN